MKRSTAVSRLRDIADGLDRVDWIDPKIVAVYIHGDILTGVAELDRVELVFMVDAPVEEVSWMARPPRLEAVAWTLRFPKLPISWCWRPACWPVWNHQIINPVRFWSLDGRLDTNVLDTITAGHASRLAGEHPDDIEVLVAQLEVERGVARRHLDRVLAGFYEPGWRREHRGDPDGNGRPEDRLWWAAAGLLELDDAIRTHAAGTQHR